MQGSWSRISGVLVFLVAACAAGHSEAGAMTAADTPSHGDMSAARAALEKHMSLLGLRLEKDTIQDVESRIGKTQRIEFHGDHGDAVVLCYISARAEDTTTVEFVSDFLNSYKKLNVFRITSEPRNEVAGQCRKSAQVSKEIATPSGLRLGLTQSELIAILGPPKKSRPESMAFEFFLQLPERVKGNLWCSHLHVGVHADFRGSTARELLVNYFAEGYQGECVK